MADTGVAVLAKRGRFLVAEPFFARGPRISVASVGRARAGDLVLLRTGRGDGRARGRRPRGGGAVLRVIGRPDRPRDVIEALMLDRGLERAFASEVEREAAAAPVEEVARRDLRDLTTFTVDPSSARDFDDAISAERLGDGAWRVWVHIADVCAHVRPGSAVDREAYRRATSVYVPGAVEPMLPAALSTDACSLVPGAERAAVSVEMELRAARVTRVAFHRSLIRSDERLDYDRVDRIFSGVERAADPWAAPLQAAREAAGALADARAGRGALTIEGGEPEFVFTADGQLAGAREVVQTEAHRLVEHLMIAANEQVATLLSDRGTPTLYRVHERPDPTAVERLVAQLDSLDVPTPPLPQPMSPSQAVDAVAACSELVDAHVRHRGRGRRGVTPLVLRAIKQASYGPSNLGHAGLRSPRYCHFTSPIRRYPDLVCHRALLDAVGAGEDPPPAAGLAEAGAWCSQRERDAMLIERDADDIARCFLLERELGQTSWDRAWEGEVIGVIGAGAFVAFGSGWQGMLPVRRLRGDWYELNEEGTILHGTRSGHAIRLGDTVTVQVDRVDVARGRVDLLPIQL